MQCPECGYHGVEDTDPYFRREHRKRHDLVVRGPRISAAAERLWGSEEVAIADAWSSPAPLQRLAYDASLACSRSSGYDSPSYPGPSRYTRPGVGTRSVSRVRPPSSDPFRMSLGGFGRAYLARADSRVVGFLMTWPEYADTVMGWDEASPSGISESRCDDILTCSFGPLWVAPKSRRQGVGSRLLSAVIQDPNRYPGPLSVLAPVSGDGAALLRAVWGDSLFFARW